jgi:hypothetical protein
MAVDETEAKPVKRVAAQVKNDSLTPNKVKREEACSECN